MLFLNNWLPLQGAARNNGTDVGEGEHRMPFEIIIPLGFVIVGLLMFFYGIKYAFQDEGIEKINAFKKTAIFIDIVLSFPTTKEGFLIFFGLVFTAMGFLIILLG